MAFELEFTLVLAGKIVGFIGYVMILVAAYREGLLWFFGSLLIPPVALIFVALHWSEAKKGFFWILAGVALVLIGEALYQKTGPVSMVRSQTARTVAT